MLKRWLLYTFKMYGPIYQLIFASTSCFSIHTILNTLHGNPIFTSWYLSIFATINFMFFMYYVRITDELKDYEVDLKYFPERPLPSGEISKKDLRILLWLVTAIMFSINFIWNFSFLPFIIAFAVFFLMGKYFFMKNILENNRLLAFATHGPAYIFLFMFIIGIYTYFHNYIFITKNHILVSIWFLLPGFIGEFTRKIRTPDEDKDGYLSYSQMLGYRPSLMVVVFFIIIHMILSLFVANSWEISPFTLEVLKIAGILFIVLCIFIMIKIPKKIFFLKLIGFSYTIFSYFVIIPNKFLN